MQVIILPWLLAWKTKPREMSLSIKGKPPVLLLYPQTADLKMPAPLVARLRQEAAEAGITVTARLAKL
jgi:hypothetical protein